jgi:hypothetical protein
LNLLKNELKQKNNKEITLIFINSTKQVVIEKLKNTYIYTIAFLSEKGKINPLAYKIYDKKKLEDDDDITKTHQCYNK